MQRGWNAVEKRGVIHTDDDHSHSGNTGHMHVVISRATHVSFRIAPLCQSSTIAHLHL